MVSLDDKLREHARDEDDLRLAESFLRIDRLLVDHERSTVEVVSWRTPHLSELKLLLISVNGDRCSLRFSIVDDKGTGSQHGKWVYLLLGETGDIHYLNEEPAGDASEVDTVIAGVDEVLSSRIVKRMRYRRARLVRESYTLARRDGTTITLARRHWWLPVLFSRLSDREIRYEPWIRDARRLASWREKVWDLPSWRTSRPIENG